ncbi:hypothetical protein FJ365_03850 [Candidatus Dependentiae bacterium]|nr:hypothetical protein [Candidatus Dependentiae bacterium]
MKTNIKLLLNVVLLGVVIEGSATNSVEKTSRQLFTAGDQDAQQAMRKVVYEAATLHQSTDGEVTELVNRKVKQLKLQQREKGYDEILAQKNNLKASLALAQDTYIKTERLRRKTVVAIEKMIERADKEALKIKAAKRRKIMGAFLAASQRSERLAWKIGLQHEYLEHLQALEDIVQQGESAEEYQDLAGKFEGQRHWFDTALKEIHSPSDKGYFLLFSKVQVLKNIMISFDRVAHLLDNRIKLANIVVQDIDKARVLALYDIQALVADKKHASGIAHEGYLTKRECGLVVEGIFNKLAARHRIDSLMAQLNTMQHELLAQQNRHLLLNELAERERQELSTVIGRLRTNNTPDSAPEAGASVVRREPEVLSENTMDEQEGEAEGATSEEAGEEVSTEEPADAAPMLKPEVTPPAGIPKETVVAALEKANKENAQLEVIVREKQQAPMPSTLPSGSTRSAVETAEKQARLQLENELQQKTVR